MANDSSEETTGGAASPEPAESAEAAEGAAEKTPVDDQAASASTDGESVPGEPDAGEAPAGLTLGSGPPAEEDELAERPVPVIRGQVDRFGVAMGTGRRKTAVARVRIKEGDGALTINGRTLEHYFPTERNQQDVLAPLDAADCRGKVDVWVRVDGGGTTGQAGAIVLGIARALQVMDRELHHTLSEGGYLTRDGRMVERKKYGYKKARKSFQFSKR